ncbi:MAG: ATP-binding protein [Gemmatimonadetes bacterium]|nr:ATP-binding protein [Gemmatimonadota bacterium]
MVWAAGVAGAIVGVGTLHPLTMAIYWFEFHPASGSFATVWEFMTFRLRAGFTPGMLVMTGVFATIGLVHGLATGWVIRALTLANLAVGQLQAELARTTASLLASPEGETLEFKSSARWDYREGKTSRAIEQAVSRTIAGFMNHRGGSLLIGVDDTGHPVGLRNDFDSLRRHDRDGFQQFLVGLVEKDLGADCCPLVHVLFQAIDGHDVCRVVVEASPRPVYVRDDRAARYLVRAGNSTRELDTRAAVEHIAAHWPHAR